MLGTLVILLLIEEGAPHLLLHAIHAGREHGLALAALGAHALRKVNINQGVQTVDYVRDVGQMRQIGCSHSTLSH